MSKKSTALKAEHAVVESALKKERKKVVITRKTKVEKYSLAWDEIVVLHVTCTDIQPDGATMKQRPRCFRCYVSLKTQKSPGAAPARSGAAIGSRGRRFSRQRASSSLMDGTQSNARPIQLQP